MLVILVDHPSGDPWQAVGYVEGRRTHLGRRVSLEFCGAVGRGSHESR